MSFEAKPVSRLRQQVERQLRAAIVSKTIVEGERLPSEGELAERFGVSRPTVREALRSLAAAGLIEKTPGANGGSFVRTLDASTFGAMLSESVGLFVDLGNAQQSEVDALRDIMEVPATRLAATHRRDHQDLTDLADILDAQKHASFDDPQVPQLDIDFHSTVAAASGNQVLRVFILALHTVAQPVRHMTLTAEIGKQTVLQHQAIVRAVERQNEAEAERAIRAHLEYLKAVRHAGADLAAAGAPPRRPGWG
jgi:GntR family transcriptional regulator, transcriptional repressor for pyruvate dehydrogenase complex